MTIKLEKLEEQKCYIIRDKSVSYKHNVTKILILEITETTIFYQNLDSSNQAKFRITKEKFNYEYEVIEDRGFQYLPNINEIDRLKQTIFERHSDRQWTAPIYPTCNPHPYDWQTISKEINKPYKL